MDTANLTSFSASGNNGLALAIKEEPDVILLEILLKDRDGLQVLKELKTNVWTKDIPVIIVTKLNTQEYWDEAYSLGAEGYVVKMDHYSYLIKKIKENLRDKANERREFTLEEVLAC
jgi:PleD family two-component response regulator